MTKDDLTQFIGCFGLITTSGEFPKIDYPGTIKEMDEHGNIWFVCTDGFGYVFKIEEIKKFEKRDKPVLIK